VRRRIHAGSRDHLRDQLGRILEVGGDHDRQVAGGMEEPARRAAFEPKFLERPSTQKSDGHDHAEERHGRQS
jgi:hypothetical protein